MNNLAIVNQSTDLAAPQEVLISALRDSFYPGAKAESVLMVLNYCKAANLDPMTKPVHIVPMSVKKPGSREYEWRDVVMPGIELYRIKADRTGRYAGQDDAEFGPEVHNDRWKMSYPQWCKVTVYKITDVGRVAYSAKVFWLESYATAGKDTDAPNAMWRKRPYGQIEKCAEAAALRKAFPEVGAQPTADEMYGKTIDVADVPAHQVIDEPPAASRTEAVKNKLAGKRKGAEITLSQVLDAIGAATDSATLDEAKKLVRQLADEGERAQAIEAGRQRRAVIDAQPADDFAIEGQSAADLAFANLSERIAAAGSRDAVMEALDLARDADLTEAQRQALETLADEKAASLN